jgi:hypothetical protein
VEGHDFEQRESRASALAWPLMSLIFIGCLLGALGGGPLSRAEAADPAGQLRVEYERVGRYGTTSRLQVFAGSGTNAVRIAMDRALLDAFQVRQIIPAPQSTQLAGDGVEFAFAREASANAPIVFELESVQTGRVGGTIRSGAISVALRQFILP